MNNRIISARECRDFLVKIKKCAENGINEIDSNKQSSYALGVTVRKMRDHIIQHLVVVGYAEIINEDVNVTRNPLISPNNDLDLFNENGLEGTHEEVNKMIKGLSRSNKL